jgi:hypothetical protein
MRFLKYTIILILVLLGAAFLIAGAGGEIPLLEYGDVKAHGLPVGFGFLIVAVLIAKFWDTTATTTHTIEKEYSPDGVLTKIREKFERRHRATPDQ